MDQQTRRTQFLRQQVESLTKQKDKLRVVANFSETYEARQTWAARLDSTIERLRKFQKELATLEHLIIDKGVLERDISEIDLRSKNAIFFMLKSGEQKTTVRGDKA